MDEPIEQAARILHQCSYAVALVGAGISAESGVPTFRGDGGLWTKYGEPDMRGFQRFMADPKGWWEEALTRRSRYGELYEALDRADPNPAHHALAQLEELGRLRHVITQNIDGLHQRAGSRAVTEIHGNRFKLRCIECEERWEQEELPLVELPPRCPRCGGLVKDDTVMFGEPIPRYALHSCYAETERCDCMLVIGTSAVVYPAAEFPLIALRRGARLLEVNVEDTPLSDVCQVVLRQPAGVVLPEVVERVRALAAA